MADKADESGFPRAIGRAPSQKEVAIVVGRKRTRLERSDEGGLVMFPVAPDDTPLMTITHGQQIVSLLTEIRDAMTTTNELLERLR